MASASIRINSLHPNYTPDLEAWRGMSEPEIDYDDRLLKMGDEPPRPKAVEGPVKPTQDTRALITPDNCPEYDEHACRCLFAERNWSSSITPKRCRGCPDAPPTELASLRARIAELTKERDKIEAERTALWRKDRDRGSALDVEKAVNAGLREIIAKLEAKAAEAEQTPALGDPSEDEIMALHRDLDASISREFALVAEMQGYKDRVMELEATATPSTPGIRPRAASAPI